MQKHDICPDCSKFSYNSSLDWCPKCGYRKRGRFVPEEKYVAPKVSKKKVKEVAKVEEAQMSIEDFFNEIPKKEETYKVSEIPF